MSNIQSTVNLVKALEQTSGTKDKTKLLTQAWFAGERVFFQIAKMAYDPLTTFGITFEPCSVSSENTFTFEDFIALSTHLANRELTGSTAQLAVLEASLSCDIEAWNTVYRRALHKDLRCGINAKRINAILADISKTDESAKQYMISMFGTMLASPAADHEKKMVGEKYLDQKLDGVRLITVLDPVNNAVTQYTRNGAINNAFDLIRERLALLLPHLSSKVVLDGEVVSKSFQELMTQVNRKHGTDTKDAKLALFDIIPYDDFFMGKCLKTQEERHTELCNMTALFQEHCGDIVYVIPKLRVNLSTKEGKETLDKFYHDTIATGYEGIMVKDVNGIYEAKRSTVWLKIKPLISVDLVVVGVEPGAKGTSLEHVLGALNGIGNNDGKEISSKVGGGFSLEQRKQIWEEYKKGGIIGHVFEVKGDALTKNKNSDTTWSIRFPEFVRWRSVDETPLTKD